MPADNKDKVTILKLQKQKQNGVKTVGVTAYDYPQAVSYTHLTLPTNREV